MMKHSLQLTAIAILVASGIANANDSLRMPTDQEVMDAAQKAVVPGQAQIDGKLKELQPQIDRALQAKPFEKQTIADVSSEGALPFVDAEKHREAHKRSAKNILEIADSIKAKGINNLGKQKSGNKEELYVFLSFSMPEDMIKKYIEQAAEYKAKVAFRGSINGEMNIRHIQKRILDLKPARFANIEINPVAYKRYAIQRVPAFAIGVYESTPGFDSSGCLPPQKYAAVSGDISLTYALGEFAKKGPEQVRRVAKNYMSGDQL